MYGYSNQTTSNCRHAKRTTVSVEDIRLSSRRNPSLSDFITKQNEQLRAERDGAAGGGTDGQPALKKRKPKEKKTS